MSAQTQAILYRFLLGLVIVEIPVMIDALNKPDFDWKWLAAGVLGGILAAIEKWIAPSIFNFPAAVSTSPVASALGAEDQTREASP